MEGQQEVSWYKVFSKSVWVCILLSLVVFVEVVSVIVNNHPTQEFYANEFLPPTMEINSNNIPDIVIPTFQPLKAEPNIPSGINKFFKPTERQILSKVAKEYCLNEEQTILLFAIRKVEQGRPGREMGCGDIKGWHPARRYAGHFEKSLRLQAQWASGTIKNHWDGNVKEFAKVYCPLRVKVWSSGISEWMERLEPPEEVAMIE